MIKNQKLCSLEPKWLRTARPLCFTIAGGDVASVSVAAHLHRRLHMVAARLKAFLKHSVHLVPRNLEFQRRRELVPLPVLRYAWRTSHGRVQGKKRAVGVIRLLYEVIDEALACE